MNVLDGQVDPRVIAGAIAFLGVMFGALMSHRSSSLKLKLDHAANRLNELKFEADETHKRAIMAIDQANSTAKMIADELSSIRNAASRLLSALEMLSSGHQISEEVKVEAVRSVSLLSLFLPPNSPFKEELGLQLEASNLILLGVEQPEFNKHVTAMRMNIWKLVDAKMEDLAAHSGYKGNSIDKISPLSAKHVI